MNAKVWFFFFFSTHELVAAMLRQVGFPEQVIPKMVCTAYHESNFICKAKHYNTWDGSTDLGLLQVILTFFFPNFPRSIIAGGAKGQERKPMDAKFLVTRSTIAQLT